MSLEQFLVQQVTAISSLEFVLPPRCHAAKNGFDGVAGLWVIGAFFRLKLLSAAWVLPARRLHERMGLLRPIGQSAGFSVTFDRACLVKKSPG